jgi:hypothetical protein
LHRAGEEDGLAVRMEQQNGDSDIECHEDRAAPSGDCREKVEVPVAYPVE